MGSAARANPKSPEGKSERERTELWLRRFVETFQTREAFEEYCDHAQVSTEERIYLETLLPAHLRFVLFEQTYCEQVPGEPASSGGFVVTDADDADYCSDCGADCRECQCSSEDES